MSDHYGLAAQDLVGLQRVAGNRAVTGLTRQMTGGSRKSAATDLPPVGGEWVGPPRGAWSGVARRLNRLLDRIPRPTIVLALGRLRVRQPAFRVWVWSGFAAGLAAGAATAPAAGLQVTTFLACALVSGLLILAALLFHRLISYALQATVLAAVLVFALATGTPPLPLLDVAAVALATAVAMGRTGCAMAGCCHGRPAWWGYRYLAAHVRLGFSAPLVGVRVVPVQLLESLWCAALALIGVLLLAALAAPGSVLATHGIGYAAGRFGFERLRGDPGRPHLAGLSQAQWTSVVVAAAILMLGALGVLPLFATHWLAAAGLLAVATLSLGVDPNGAREPEPHDWAEVAGATRGLAPRPETLPAVYQTGSGLRLSLAAAGTGAGALSTYGISHRFRALDAAEVRAVADLILQLRHPGRRGLLLRAGVGPDCLVVSDPGPTAPGSMLPHHEEST
jgi:hypothetical protein